MNLPDLRVANLGECRFETPMLRLFGEGLCDSSYVDDSTQTLWNPDLEFTQNSLKQNSDLPALEVAGPRRKIFFQAKKVKAAILTCGGLCPGLNDVIRGIVMELHYRYGVEKILGIRYGFHGLDREAKEKPMMLDPSHVSGIHHQGGSILGLSRGRPDISVMADYLQKEKIDLLFLIGGDGTMRGALDVAQEMEKRGQQLSVIGIPKTIDNDILYLDRSFGFNTAVSKAAEAIQSAHVEAKGAANGIGLVKLMGRHSGFIACQAVLGMSDANFVLIPEVAFELHGENGLLAALEERIQRKPHAVVVVAEGAGQEYLSQAATTHDASGNEKLQDIGLFLKAEIQKHFAARKCKVNLKYIDPSYMIRSVKANAWDSLYCWRLAQNAVHAAMAGKTRTVIGLRHNQYVHLPMRLVATGRQHVDAQGALWMSVLEATGQPTSFLKMFCAK